jgi:hypothetical protein
VQYSKEKEECQVLIWGESVGSQAGRTCRGASHGSRYFLMVGINAEGAGPEGWDSSLVRRTSSANDVCP